MKRNPILMALTSLLVLGSEPSYAAAEDQTGACGPDLIPVVLTATTDESGYILPNCSKCKRVKVERQTTASGGTQAVLGLTYHDYDRREFSGTIVVTALLADDRERVVTIEEVWLSEGEEAAWVLDASSGVGWAEVDMVWIELVPAA